MNKQKISLGEQLQIICVLLEKYGKKLTLPSFQEEIAKINTELVQLIAWLDATKRLNLKSLRRLIETLQKDSEKKQSFRIKGNCGRSQVLEAFLSKKFENAEWEYQIATDGDLSLSVKGAGYAYSRSLDRDLEKLLG